MRWWGPIGITGGALAAIVSLAATAPDPAIADQRRRLLAAKAAATIAAARVDETLHIAATERDAAARARAQRTAVTAEVAEAEADLVTAQARVTLVDRLLADQRARLAREQAPAARLLGALASLARRPALAGIAQPGSVDDLVHLRAVLGSAVPAIRVRTQAVRAELAATRAREADASLAAATLAESRVALSRRRTEFADLEAQHGGQADRFGRVALAQSDRAIALGEQARDIVDAIAATGGRQATLAELETLAGPAMPSDGGGAAAAPASYRLPAQGRLTTGFGELSPAGVRARGLTLAVAPGAGVAAPAAGRIAYAGRFLGYGGIVIVDHGAGWTSLVTGLGSVEAIVGSRVRAGARIGTAGTGEDPRVTIELRRRGRPVDLAALL